jgi:hypothetical protein
MSSTYKAETARVGTVDASSAHKLWTGEETDTDAAASDAASGGATASTDLSKAAPLSRHDSEGPFDSPDELMGGPQPEYSGKLVGCLVPPELVRHVRLVVWDFDQTLLRIHSWALQILPAQVAARRMADDFADLPLFIALVRALVAAGVAVAVASFGRYETIQTYLDIVLGPGLFTRDNISTPSMVGSRDGFQLAKGKNTQLQALAAQFRVKPDQVIFFDGTLL